MTSIPTVETMPVPGATLAADRNVEQPNVVTTRAAGATLAAGRRVESPNVEAMSAARAAFAADRRVEQPNVETMSAAGATLAADRRVQQPTDAAGEPALVVRPARTAAGTLSGLVSWPGRALVAVLLAAIAAYRSFRVRRVPVCRFEPTCSSYAEQALRRYGLFKGVAKSAWRIARCHPFGGQGYDPP